MWRKGGATRGQRPQSSANFYHCVTTRDRRNPDFHVTSVHLIWIKDLHTLDGTTARKKTKNSFTEHTDHSHDLLPEVSAPSGGHLHRREQDRPPGGRHFFIGRSLGQEQWQLGSEGADSGHSGATLFKLVFHHQKPLDLKGLVSTATTFCVYLNKAGAVTSDVFKVFILASTIGNRANLSCAYVM